jgi:hypothetical protein
MTNNDAPNIQTLQNTGRRPLMLALQLVGFLIGLALLAWCGKIAFSGENREAMSNLGEAPPNLMITLVLLSVLGVILDGLTIWLVLRPVRRIQLSGMLATNALATFLSLLPFKLSVMTRVAIHRKRDGVPLAIIGPWFAAVGAVMLAAIAPILLLAAWRPEIDLLWIAMLVVSLLLVTVMLSVAARTLGGQRGLRLIQAFAERQPIRLIERITKSETFILLDEGLAMLADFKNTLAAVGLRVLYIASMAARLFVASRIVGNPLPTDQSLFGSVAYFFIGIVSPVGALGAREGGTAKFLEWFGEIDFEQLAVIMLVVTGSEILANTALAAIGIAWLRPDRLIRGAAKSDLPSADAHSTRQSEPDGR